MFRLVVLDSLPTGGELDKHCEKSWHQRIALHGREADRESRAYRLVVLDRNKYMGLTVSRRG